MKTTTMMMMFLVFTMGGCLMEDLPLAPLEPDAEPPTEEVDATPPVVEPDATVPETPDAGTTDCDATVPLPPDATVPEVPDATVPVVPDATVPETPDAGTPECDATVPLPPDAAPVPPPDATPVTPDVGCPTCASDADCSDGYSWTNDFCVSGACGHNLSDCGGMQIRPSESAVTCMFWAGFASAEPAPALGSFVPEGLATGPAGGLWKAAPASACSVICSSGGNRVPLDIQTEWSGATSSLAHAQYDAVTNGTFDGLNLEY